ncbi:MAG: 2-phospho-L-lactate guanylyltransferase [Anaerolineae bacterium]|nr:2-phospho-L-lactate guanylyltransferase [Anaerolineae bacterium]
MNVWAIVPVKPLNRAKSRLAPVLSPELRMQLATAMLRNTVSTLTQCLGISGIFVISRDTRALVIAREYGAKTVQESGTPELNAALERASRVIASWNAQASLVLPADLPLLNPSDLNQMLEDGRYHRSAVIVPDKHEHGTNGLLLRPPGLIPYLFGNGSFRQHLEAAEAAGATVNVCRSERLTLDLDTPDDLPLYLELCHKYHVEPLIDLSEALLMSAVAQPENPQ